MTGNGTQASPYIVTDWNELAQVFPTAQYIELGNDIQAPDLPTNLTADYLVSFDGKGHSIVGMHNTSGYAFTFDKQGGGAFYLTIKDVSFNNINCQGTGFLRVGGTNSGGTIRISGIVFNGNIYANEMCYINTWATSLLNGVGGYIHTNNANFKLAITGSSTSKLSNGNFTLDYGSIEPSPTYSVFDSPTVENTVFKIKAPENGKIFFNKCKYCSFTGNGNIKIGSTAGINVVEDTLVLDEASTGTNQVLPIADIKNVQVLYDLGFPASGVV